MSIYSTSLSDNIVAWAIPVSLAQYGARHFAYVETKLAIIMFHLVARTTTVTACHSLSEEIKSIIASKLRDIVFKHRMKEWVKFSKCLAHRCMTISHVLEAELNTLAFLVPSNNVESDEGFASPLANNAAETHQEDVEHYRKVLMNLKGKSRLAKCVRVRTYPSHRRWASPV